MNLDHINKDNNNINHYDEDGFDSNYHMWEGQILIPQNNLLNSCKNNNNLFVKK